MHGIIKIYSENECFPKLDQSDSKVNALHPKSYKSVPKVTKSGLRMTPECPIVARLTRSLILLAPSWPSWPLKIHWKNEYILLLGPFGSDIRRYDMHYKCHSTSICRLGGPLFTFRPLSSIIFLKIRPKVTPSWPLRCIESLKSIGKMSVSWNWTRVTPR